jgi:hypothetical protein
MQRKTKLLFFLLLAGSLIINVALAYAYVHYIVQVDNIFTIGAMYQCKVSVSYWTTPEKLLEFNVVAGQVLGRGLANLYWGEMVGYSPKTSPIFNITNTSPDKVTNMTWIIVNPPVGVTVNAYFVEADGARTYTWAQGTAGAKRLAIGESFQAEFLLFADYHSMPDGTYNFDIDVRCED